MFVLGVLIFTAGLLFLALIETNHNFAMIMNIFLDWPTTFSFIVVIAAVIIATDGLKTFITAINAILSKECSILASDKEKAIRLFRLLGKSVNYASILLVVLGIRLMLISLSDPYSLGPRAATALASLFQGLFINLIFINPAINILQTRYNTEEKTVVSEKQVIDKLLELCNKQGISPEEILNANEIHFKNEGYTPPLQ